MSNMWKSWTNNLTSAFGNFDHPTDKVDQNCKFSSSGHYSYGPVYGPTYRPYNPFDTDWLDLLKGTYDMYTYTLTWKDNVAEVEMDIPGVKKEGISVIFEQDHISINSDRKGIKSTRKVAVETAALDHDKCEALLADGVLSLKLVRKTPVKKTLTIK